MNYYSLSTKKRDRASMFVCVSKLIIIIEGGEQLLGHRQQRGVLDAPGRHAQLPGGLPGQPRLADDLVVH